MQYRDLSPELRSESAALQLRKGYYPARRYLLAQGCSPEASDRYLSSQPSQRCSEESLRYLIGRRRLG